MLIDTVLERVQGIGDEYEGRRGELLDVALTLGKQTKVQTTPGDYLESLYEYCCHFAAFFHIHKFSADGDAFTELAREIQSLPENNGEPRRNGRSY
ncbi:MAG: hypothetical protein ABIH37_03485 [archaeon]